MSDDQKISFLPVPDRDEVPEGVTRLWDRSGEAMGFVPNVFRTQALNGEEGTEDLQAVSDLTVPMRDAGLDDHEIMEAVQVIGMFNMTNRISSALGFVPNEEYHSQARQ